MGLSASTPTATPRLRRPSPPLVACAGRSLWRLLEFARMHVPGRRCFAVEGAGSYGAGLTRLLVERGEWVVEVDRPSSARRRRGDGGPRGAAGRAPRPPHQRPGQLLRCTA
jgi:hypothetical protein